VSLKTELDNEEAIAKYSLSAAVLLKEKCRRDPVFWLSNYVKTVKEHRKDDEEAVQPFPMKPYIAPIVEEWLQSSILHIVKSRQMSMSWLSLAMLLWESQFNDYCLNVIINKALEDSINGVERVKMMYNSQPAWLKHLCPTDRKMRDMPREYLTFACGSKILALPQGADKIRGLVPKTALMDEASFQDECESTYGACVPCSKRIVCVSSAGPGFFQRLVAA